MGTATCWRITQDAMRQPSGRVLQSASTANTKLIALLLR